MLDQKSVACECRDHERSTLDRPLLFLPVIVFMFVSFGFLFALADLPFGVQIGSLIPYTAFVVLGTFSAQRGQQPYFFGCSVVQQAMPRLVRRHCVFLAAIVLLETIALYLTRYMPASWITAKERGEPPFAISLCVVCLCLGGVEMFTNRSLLERAHAGTQECL
jgi:hypothetical protein